jgi:hypothetical protein
VTFSNVQRITRAQAQRLVARLRNHYVTRALSIVTWAFTTEWYDGLNQQSMPFRTFANPVKEATALENWYWA